MSPAKAEEIANDRNLKRRQEGNRDEFKELGVKTQDKMTFFLLKWIFNAIKIDSDESDAKLKGLAYIQKMDLIKQL
jgi:hypothetical protein